MTKKTVGFIFCIFCLLLIPDRVSSEPGNLHELQNGIKVIYIPCSSSENTVVQLFINGGQIFEPTDKSGINYLCSRLILEPNSNSQIKTLNETGSSFGLNAYGDYSVFKLESLSKNLKVSLEIFGSLLSKPLLSPTRIHYMKKYMELLQKNEMDNPSSFSILSVKQLLFTKKYNHSIYGDKQSLKNISVKDIQNHYKNLFIKNNFFISVSSDIPIKKILTLLNKYLKNLKIQPEKLITDLPNPSPANERTIFEERDLKQTTITLGFPLGELSFKNYLQTELLTNLLGKGIGSILWKLRSEYKLAYSISSRFIYLKSSSILLVKLSSENAKRVEAYTRMKEIIDNLFSTGINNEKFESIKNFTKLRFLKTTETKSSQAYTAGFFQHAGFGDQTTKKFASVIDNITLEEFNQFIKSSLKKDSLLEIIFGKTIFDSPAKE